MNCQVSFSHVLNPFPIASEGPKMIYIGDWNLPSVFLTELTIRFVPLGLDVNVQTIWITLKLFWFCPPFLWPCLFKIRKNRHLNLLYMLIVTCWDKRNNLLCCNHIYFERVFFKKQSWFYLCFSLNWPSQNVHPVCVYIATEIVQQF